MGAVAKEKAGVGSAVNDATRLFGATLGVAVIGSIAASMYSTRLGVTLPAALPAPVVAAAEGSVGGALVAAQALGRAGAMVAARALDASAVQAFLHAFRGALEVAGTVAIAGGLFAARFLPSRPAAERGGLAPMTNPVADRPSVLAIDDAADDRATAEII
jgi:hypothetical protein